MKRLEVLFSPTEFEALPKRDLAQTTCVVFDILRATTSLMTALAQGAASVVPVETIQEALTLKEAHPAWLLAGERDGFRITRDLTGSIDFDFGNSPREFAAEKVSGRTLVMTTTNGTRALKACRSAQKVLAGAFLNLTTLAGAVGKTGDLLVVCSGTHEEASMEDTLAAGALVDAVWPEFEQGHIADSAQIARLAYLACRENLEDSMRFARNGRRLLGIPALRGDVPYCLRRDTLDFVAAMGQDGHLTRTTVAKYE